MQQNVQDSAMERQFLRQSRISRAKAWPDSSHPAGEFYQLRNRDVVRKTIPCKTTNQIYPDSAESLGKTTNKGVHYDEAYAAAVSPLYLSPKSAKNVTAVNTPDYDVMELPNSPSQVPGAVKEPSDHSISHNMYPESFWPKDYHYRPPSSLGTYRSKGSLHHNTHVRPVGDIKSPSRPKSAAHFPDLQQYSSWNSLSEDLKMNLPHHAKGRIRHSVVNPRQRYQGEGDYRMGYVPDYSGDENCYQQYPSSHGDRYRHGNANGLQYGSFSRRPPNSHVKRNNFKCPVFSGKYADWKIFKMLFVKASEVNNWDHNEQLFQLINNLEGEAKAFVSSLDEDECYMSMSQLMSKLEHRFGSGRNPQHYESLLMNKSWTANTDPRQFSDEVRRLVSLSYPTCPVEYKENLIKRHFIMGIHDNELRYQLGLQKLITLEDVVSFVERWVDTQASLKSKVTRSHHSVRMVAPAPDSDVESDSDSENDYEPIQFVASKSKRFASEKSFHKRNSRSYSDKPNFGDRKQFSPRAKDSYSKEPNWSTIRCYHCGGLGHFVKECPSVNRVEQPLNS